MYDNLSISRRIDAGYEAHRNESHSVPADVYFTELPQNPKDGVVTISATYLATDTFTAIVIESTLWSFLFG